VRTDATAKKHTASALFCRHDVEGRVDKTDPFDLRLFAVLRNLLRWRAGAESHVVAPSTAVGCGKYLLQHERAMISGMGERGVGRPLGQVRADSIGTDEKGRLEDPMLRGRSRPSRSTRRRCRRRPNARSILAKAGSRIRRFSSAMKYYGTELNKRRYEILMSAGGVDALEWESERSRGGARPRAWLRTKANSIEGGTSEVMLGIVAKRILDLPGA